jgi:hypothetical protein
MAARDHQVLVRILHRAAPCTFEAPGGPTGISVTRYIRSLPAERDEGLYPWICVQALIDHDPVDEVVYNCGDAVSHCGLHGRPVGDA